METQTKKQNELLIEGSNSCGDYEWEVLLWELDGLLENKGNDYGWKCSVKNFGWRNLSGYSKFQFKNGLDFLQKVLPRTDCNFTIYDDGKGFKMQNAHHDSPTGNEW